MMPYTVHPPQAEWRYQWSHFHDREEFLFKDWIWPHTLEEFRGKFVLDAGCGSGQHIEFVAPYAAQVVGIDLNTSDLARERTRHLHNVTILEGDMALFTPEKPFDVVYCIGAIHHTDDPDRTFQNLLRCLRPGGLLIIWCYSSEGNELVRKVVEPIRKAVLAHLPRPLLHMLAIALTTLLYMPVYSFYLLSLAWLPFYEYFQNFRKLSFCRNVLNVFDKLNAPQVEFIDRAKMMRWFNERDFENIHVDSYKGVSWRGSGTKRCPR